MTNAELHCPWLGTEEDEHTHHGEPIDEHLCYAQNPPGGIGLEHQGRYCLGARHAECRFYRRPPAAEAAPVIIPQYEDEDEEATRARRSGLQIILWVAAAIIAIAVLYTYLPVLLSHPSTATPGATLTGTAAGLGDVTATPTPPRPTAAATASATAFAFGNATATPTPYPGGAIYALTPAAGAAGWFASDESRGNQLGDSYLYTGVFDGVIYHGAFQLDLSGIPRGATLHAGTLEMAGLDASRLGTAGTWELRILDRAVDADWARHTFQDVHNAAVQWTLPPALSPADLAGGKLNVFSLSPEQLRDIEARLLDEHYTLTLRVDGPLAGENSLFAWDTGYGPATQGGRPRLLLNAGAAPETPIPTGPLPATDTPTPTETPEYLVLTSTPTPGNAVTAAVVALTATARATTTGTPTPLPPYLATATPVFDVVTPTRTPENAATASFLAALATANARLYGTPTPPTRPQYTATPTPGPTWTPRPTSTPAVIWLDELRGTPTPIVTPTPTLPPIPSQFRDRILFLSDRRGSTDVYVVDPDTGRIGLVTAAWPYEQARRDENVSPDGKFHAYVANDPNHTTQIYVYSADAGASWQLTFLTGTTYSPVWSPTGGQIAFVSTHAGSDDLYVIDSDGENLRRLTLNEWEWDKSPSWSPDGRRIVFWSNQSTGRKQLWLINADGTNRHLLVDSPYNDWDPVWVK